MNNSPEGQNLNFFTVKEAPGAGRGAFSTQDIPRGTSIHVADDLTAHVLLREYRGEICWHCFAYDYGKKLPVRDPLHGFSFCSGECERGMRQRYDDEVCLHAWAAVEKLSLKANKTKWRRDDDDIGVVDDNSQANKPTLALIDEAWRIAEHTAACILTARTHTTGVVTREHKRALQQALNKPPSADVMAFHTHTILSRYHSPELWPSILSLEEDPCPYTSLQELHEHTTSYLQLMAVLPEDLLPFVTADTLRTIKTHEVHNSFGIRSLEDEGSEFFGYGVWPSASYFNHSCRPNIRRHRVGRTWVFRATGDIPAGQELYISYLNGEEDGLTTSERKTRLRKTWGFDCVCERCKT